MIVADNYRKGRAVTDPRVIDLDAERAARPSEQVIKLGGEEFRARMNVKPEVLVEWDDFYLAEDQSAVNAIAVADRVVLAFLYEADRPRYLALRERDDDPITAGDVRALVEGLTAAHVGRPTEPSKTSSVSTGSVAVPSKDGSSSPEATPSG